MINNRLNILDVCKADKRERERERGGGVYRAARPSVVPVTVTTK